MTGKNVHYRTVAVFASLSILGSVLAIPSPALAVQNAPAENGASVQKEAARLEAAGKWNEAAQAYTRAAAAFENENNAGGNVKALEKSAEMFEKYALMLEQKAKGAAGAPAAQDAPQRGDGAGTAPHPAAAGTPPLALESSSLIARNKRGELVVAEKNGRAIVGVKLSRHDKDISNPGIVVAADGVIHVCFVEQHATTYNEF